MFLFKVNVHNYLIFKMGGPSYQEINPLTENVEITLMDRPVFLQKIICLNRFRHMSKYLDRCLNTG